MLKVDQPATYPILVQGRLDAGWEDWFNGLTVVTGGPPDGPSVTSLTGTVADQSALHGLLERIRDLGLPLLEVHHVGVGEVLGPE